ncbi:MAG: response regulator [Lachnospiraceae bacterium]|jgi:YesN/AraC family two-component response regulator|nr:response regulator [Lachnospiraceae bacterium]MCH4032258.1 response regulator [Lachnospiraceae bacterium]MCH4108864.1 response regulator [Lachnospiraceae bacterium]MCI1303151.1 response regulator [Lachnospiraceae bacterium]MCI1332662.1 response regulator [Lachnospiraceae bacterium]
MYELLIADDEEISRDSLATYFPWTDNGFHVAAVVSNGREALDFIERHPVHVILTDINMPEMSGLELTKALYDQDPHPIIVLLSAYSDFTYAQEAIQYGVRFYILKPSSFKEIASTFAQIRKELDDQYQDTSSQSDDECIQKIQQYIHENYQKGTLNDLSQKLFLSPSYLSQFIKLKTGKTFTDMLIDEKMKQARFLLSDPARKVYTVSEAVGYSNPNNFTRTFRSYFKQSPKEYQMTHAKKK